MVQTKLARTFGDASAGLDGRMDEAVGSPEPAIVKREGKPAVVVLSFADWNSWQTTAGPMSKRASDARLRQSVAEAERGERRLVTADELSAIKV